MARLKIFRANWVLFFYNKNILDINDFCFYCKYENIMNVKKKKEIAFSFKFDIC